MKKHSYLLKLDESLFRKVRARAALDGISFNRAVIKLLEEWIKDIDNQ